MPDSDSRGIGPPVAHDAFPSSQRRDARAHLVRPPESLQGLLGRDHEDLARVCPLPHARRPDGLPPHLCLSDRRPPPPPTRRCVFLFPCRCRQSRGSCLTCPLNVFCALQSLPRRLASRRSWSLATVHSRRGHNLSLGLNRPRHQRARTPLPIPRLPCLQTAPARLSPSAPHQPGTPRVKQSSLRRPSPWSAPAAPSTYARRTPLRPSLALPVAPRSPAFSSLPVGGREACNMGRVLSTSSGREREGGRGGERGGERGVASEPVTSSSRRSRPRRTPPPERCGARGLGPDWAGGRSACRRTARAAPAAWSATRRAR